MQTSLYVTWKVAIMYEKAIIVIKMHSLQNCQNERSNSYITAKSTQIK